MGCNAYTRFGDTTHPSPEHEAIYLVGTHFHYRLL